MDITAINGTTAASASVASATNELSRDVFLELVVKELQHQNPLEPVTGSDFVAQLAQLGTMEQTEKLNGNLLALLGNSGADQLARVAQLVGRRIEFADPGTGEILPGIVSAVSLVDGEVVLDVGTSEPVPLGNLTRVLDGALDGIPVSTPVDTHEGNG